MNSVIGWWMVKVEGADMLLSHEVWYKTQMGPLQRQLWITNPILFLITTNGVRYETHLVCVNQLISPRQTRHILS